MIIYNIPKHTAIDIVNGRSYSFMGDTALLTDDFVRNFHLQPSRILHRINPGNSDPTLKSFQLAGKQVLLVNQTTPLVTVSPRPQVDLLVLSGNPRLYISHLFDAFIVKQIVIDGSVPRWKAALWKRDCDSLRIPCYDVSEKGAFVMNW